MEDGSKIKVLNFPLPALNFKLKKTTRKSVSRILYLTAGSKMPVIYLRCALLQNLS